MIGLIKGTARQLKTVSGLPLPIASYKSNSKLPIKAIGLPFSCTQSGSGDPAPDNIRPITGVSIIHIYQEEACKSEITGWEVVDAEGRIRFSYSNTYTGTSTPTYGILFYRDGELDTDMTIGDGISTNIVRTAAEDTIVARDIGNGIYARSYMIVDGVTIYGEQIFAFWGVSEITSYARYDDAGRIKFTYSNSTLYTGSYTIAYGVLIYSYGNYAGEMLVGTEDLSDTALSKASGTFRTRDLGNGVTVRTYIKINDAIVYGTQLYIKWSDLPPLE